MYINFNWAVIGTEDIGMDCCLFQFLIQTLGCDKVIKLSLESD